MEGKFFRPFQVFYLVDKEDYKLKLLKKWKINDVFYMSLLKQNTTKERQADKNIG